MYSVRLLLQAKFMYVRGCWIQLYWLATISPLPHNERFDFCLLSPYTPFVEIPHLCSHFSRFHPEHGFRIARYAYNDTAVDIEGDQHLLRTIYLWKERPSFIGNENENRSAENRV